MFITHLMTTLFRAQPPVKWGGNVFAGGTAHSGHAQWSTIMNPYTADTRGNLPPPSLWAKREDIDFSDCGPIKVKRLSEDFDLRERVKLRKVLQDVSGRLMEVVKQPAGKPAGEPGQTPGEPGRTPGEPGQTPGEPVPTPGQPGIIPEQPGIPPTPPQPPTFGERVAAGARGIANVVAPVATAAVTGIAGATGLILADYATGGAISGAAAAYNAIPGRLAGGIIGGLGAGLGAAGVVAAPALNALSGAGRTVVNGLFNTGIAQNRMDAEYELAMIRMDNMPMMDAAQEVEMDLQRRANNIAPTRMPIFRNFDESIDIIGPRSPVAGSPLESAASSQQYSVAGSRSSTGSAQAANTTTESERVRFMTEYIGVPPNRRHSDGSLQGNSSIIEDVIHNSPSGFNTPANQRPVRVKGPSDTGYGTQTPARRGSAGNNPITPGSPLLGRPVGNTIGSPYTIPLPSSKGSSSSSSSSSSGGVNVEHGTPILDIKGKGKSRRSS